MAEEKGPLVGRLLSMRDPELLLPCPWPSPAFPIQPSAFVGVWGLSARSSSHQPVPPQLQQTEAELRKMDEAIALFQRML